MSTPGESAQVARCARERDRRLGARLFWAGPAITWLTVLASSLVNAVAGRPLPGADVAVALFVKVALATSALGLIVFGRAASLRSTSPRGGRVDVVAGGLVIHEETGLTTVLASEIDCGFVDDLGRAVIRMKRGADFELKLDGGEPAAQRLLARLGLDPTRRTAWFPAEAAEAESGSLLRIIGALVWASSFGMFLLLVLTLPTSLLRARSSGEVLLTIVRSVPMLLATGWVIRRLGRWFLRRRVVVGNDSIVIEGSRRRVIRLGDVERVDRTDGGVRVKLWSGAEVKLTAALGGDAMGKRIEAVLESGQRSHDGVLVERAGRDLATWRAALVKLVANDEDYRTRPNLLELECVLEDGRAPIDQRVGAALALRLSSGPEAKARIQVAVESTADPDTAALLEAAAEGEVDVAKLERAERSR